MPVELPDSSRHGLKILMTTDAVGGVWQYSVDLVSELTRHGAEVLLAVLGPEPSAGQKSQIESIAHVTLVHRDYALEWMPEPWRDVDASGDWLMSLDAGFNADIIHLNGYSHAALPWRKPVIVVAHSCVCSWWRAVHKTFPPGEWDEYRRRVECGIKSASALIAPSRFMATALADAYELPLKAEIIHNFSLLPEFRRVQKEAFSFAAGRIWDKAKNLAVLRSIAGALDWPLFIAGNDDRLGEWACDSGNVHFSGSLAREEMTERLHAASIFVHPALYEPFGLSVLEAARSRCCLVLSDIPSLRELWDGAAVFVDPRDPEHWQFELNWLCRDFSTRQELSKRAYLHARRYSAAKSVAAYLEMYQHLAAQRSTEAGVAA